MNNSKKRFRAVKSQNYRRKKDEPLFQIKRDRKPVVPMEVYSKGPQINDSPYKNIFEEIENKQLAIDKSSNTLNYDGYRKSNGKKICNSVKICDFQ